MGGFAAMGLFYRGDPDLRVAKRAAEERLLVAHQQQGALRLFTGPPMLAGLVTGGTEVASEGLLQTLARDVLGEEAEKMLAGFENIVGIGIKEKIRNDQRTGQKCIAVFVINKLPADAIDETAFVPDEIEGIPTDVVATGEFRAQSERHYHRPAPCGVSIGHGSGTIGTLGFPASDPRNGHVYVVGCNHVMACENTAQVGDVVLQPSGPDGGNPETHALAKLERWVDLRFGWWFGWRPNRVDAALAVVTDATGLLSPQLYGVGTISREVCPPEPDLAVYKVGRSSSVTHGTVVGIDVTLRVDHLSQRRAYMVEQLLVESLNDKPFSEGGDSGALVVEVGTRRPVGMLCAGTLKGYSLVTPVQTVLDDLGVSFLW